MCRDVFQTITGTWGMELGRLQWGEGAGGISKTEGHKNHWKTSTDLDHWYLLITVFQDAHPQVAKDIITEFVSQQGLEGCLKDKAYGSLEIASLDPDSLRWRSGRRSNCETASHEEVFIFY